MFRGSPSSCHRAVLTVIAVAVCVVAPVSAAAQTRTNFTSSITSETMTAVWVARERGLFKKARSGNAVYRHAALAVGYRGVAGRRN